jgi:hypothetical protein
VSVPPSESGVIYTTNISAFSLPALMRLWSSALSGVASRSRQA